MKNSCLSFLYFLSVFASAQNLNVVLRSQFPIIDTCTGCSYQATGGIWGYTDTLGNEYALVTASKGLVIVDITNPDAPALVKQIPGAQGTAHEVRTWGKYAYYTADGFSIGGGLQIIDLSNLPGTNIPYKSWKPIINGAALNTIHALHIENARAYLYGSNRANGGIVIADLTDPWNPVYLGKYSGGYVHDGYVRNDTIYPAHVNGGYFSIMNATNPASPVILATQNTPRNFTHNTWLSDDGKTVFTTDEVNNSTLTAYDITNIGNITELDRIGSTLSVSGMVHNTTIVNDWAVTSWYRDGMHITDAHRPQNLVHVGWYDTYPAGSGGGIGGAWGIYPYFPSGNIVVSNMYPTANDGLFVLTPAYVRACYLEGTVTDSLCGTPMNNVTVQIVSTNASTLTSLLGEYKTGYHTPGTYTVTFSKAGYNTKTITGVPLSAATVTNLNVQLSGSTLVSFSGKIITASGSNPIPGCNVELKSSNNTYSSATDSNGDFSLCNILANTYTITAGKWGYETVCFTQTVTPSSNTVLAALNQGIYDDFTFNFGWTATGTASTGKWVRDAPIGTTFTAANDANPGVDDSTDCREKCFVTGNTSGSATIDDIDNGFTLLASPVFDLSGFADPYINYSRWFFNAGGTSPVNDSLIVRLSNGTTEIMAEAVTASTPGMSSWIQKGIRALDFLTLSSAMQIKFYAVDAGSPHIVEAGMDKFFVTEGPASVNSESVPNAVIKIYPNPFNTLTTIALSGSAKDLSGSKIMIYDILGNVTVSFEIENTNLSAGQAGEIRVSRGNLADGIYFFRIEKNSRELAKGKLIVR